MTIAAVIFDRDNTLVQYDEQAVGRLEGRLLRAAPGLPPGAAFELWGAWPGPWPRTPADEPAFWSAFWGTLVRRYGLAADAEAEMQRIGAFAHTCYRAYDDSAPTLRALRLAGLRLAVLTNFELPSVDRTLAYAGLDPAWFDALLSSAAIGASKPDPRAYQAAAAALGQPPAACAFVDDLPANVAGACAAGMRGVLLDRRGRHGGSGLETIGGLGEIAALLR